MALTAAADEELSDMLAAIEAEMGSLSEWERGFVTDQLARYAKYGADIFMSAKQWAALSRIYEKVTGSSREERKEPDDDEDDEIPF